MLHFIGLFKTSINAILNRQLLKKLTQWLCINEPSVERHAECAYYFSAAGA